MTPQEEKKGKDREMMRSGDSKKIISTTHSIMLSIGTEKTRNTYQRQVIPAYPVYRCPVKMKCYAHQRR
jgi:hypothetical protein